MALIKCPECEQMISDKAMKCPKCGYPIQEDFQKEAEPSDEMSDLPVEESPVQTESPVELEANESVASVRKRRNKKLIFAGAAVVTLVILAVAAFFMTSAANVTVEDVQISKWRLIDSGTSSDTYEGTVTSDQKAPFVAVIGQYTDEDDATEFVYVEDGKGILRTYEDSDEDPSVKYRPIGYLNGINVKESDVKVSYKDRDYYDWSWEETDCFIDIMFEMKTVKTGILVFDLINETNNDTDLNLIAVIINGKSKYVTYVELPYKARGIDVTIVPKFFCESDKITENDYVTEKAFSAEKEESSYSKNYSGEMVLSFPEYKDGWVLYTRELIEGGRKEDRNTVYYARTFLHEEECTISTYTYVDKDETLLMPKYDFNFAGYITWKSIIKENV